MALRIDAAMDEMNEKLVQALTRVGAIVENAAKHNCPVDTGNLRGSIHFQVEPMEKAVYIGTNVNYAPYVEMGTQYQNAQPFLQPAIDENRDKIEKEFEGII